VVGIQVEYSLAERGADRELLPMAEALGLGAALWSPLAGGLLTGKYRATRQGRLTDVMGVVQPENTDQKTAIVDTLQRIATQTGTSASQVAMAWLRARAEQSATAQVPILGPRTIAQLEDYLAALDVQLSPEHVDQLDKVSAVELGVPHHSADGVIDQAAGGSLSSFLPRATPIA
jgi:aryl-alcohol dehydrogenase-like predicted oxidoreductase